MGPEFEQSFPVPLARTIVSDLRAPRAWVYWIDMLCCAALGWGSFALLIASPDYSVQQVLFGLVAGLALYRGVIFTHELAHAPREVFCAFRTSWNWLCGFPMLVPSFTYRGVHRDHHRRDVYGRKNDGEYVPFGADRPYKIVLYALLPVVLPLLFAARFTLLVPLAYLNRRVRRFVWQRASSLTIDLSYRRRMPSVEEAPVWRRQELGSFAYASGAIALVAVGVWPVRVLVAWYAVAVLVLFVNSLRTLAAHRYRNPGDQSMELSEQFLDSVDVPGHRFWTALWAPVGLRYHATHHLFPSIPYHALRSAHLRLVAELPDNRIYLRATRKSLRDALGRLWQDARASQVEPEHRLSFS